MFYLGDKFISEMSSELFKGNKNTNNITKHHQKLSDSIYERKQARQLLPINYKKWKYRMKSDRVE